MAESEAIATPKPLDKTTCEVIFGTYLSSKRGSKFKETVHNLNSKFRAFEGN
jgi:hypothetical protein